VIFLKRALITGITGQDGSYLAELLLEKGYEVYGLVRRTSVPNMRNLKEAKIVEKVKLLVGDLTDQMSLIRALEKSEPDEVYNLAAQSFVKASWEIPTNTWDVTAKGVVLLLEAIKLVNPKIKFYQASSSEMFGKVAEIPQNEKTPFHPRSPYACAKVFAHHITVNFRESYGMFCCCGILFNHESPRRGIEFVTRKITDGVARIKLGLIDCLYLGNLEAKRDWGYAKDYVKAMWLMLQQDEPDDYVVATGETHSVKEFVEEAFRVLGIEISWKGKGIEEIGFWKDKPVVKIDPKFFRPAEVYFLQGDASKAKEKLNWSPEVKFKDLVKIMVDADLKRLS